MTGLSITVNTGDRDQTQMQREAGSQDQFNYLFKSEGLGKQASGGQNQRTNKQHFHGGRKSKKHKASFKTRQVKGKRERRLNGGTERKKAKPRLRKKRFYRFYRSY